MKICHSNSFLCKNRKAITFVELMVCILVASLVFKVIFDFMSNTRNNYIYGVVNLQNLQEARLAINYLRRDFASSCPRFNAPTLTDNDKKFDDNEWQKFPNLRGQLFEVSQMDLQSIGESDQLITVYDHGLRFYKFVSDSTGVKPKIELVTYQFDSTSHTLLRTSTLKGQQRFSGFEDVEFCLYSHSINPDVPLLWVRFKINEASNVYGANNLEKNTLELTTTISSSFINSSQNNKYWRYQTGFTTSD